MSIEITRSPRLANAKGPWRLHAKFGHLDDEDEWLHGDIRSVTWKAIALLIDEGLRVFQEDPDDVQPEPR